MSKRGNGEGTVFQRQDGRWQGQLTLPPTGLSSSRRVTRYGATQREVLAKLNNVRREVEQGVQVGRRFPTIKQYGDTFLDQIMAAEVARGRVRSSTVSNYRVIWDVHINPPLGHLRLDELTPALLRQWSAERASALSAHTGRPLAASTQVRVFAVLRAALNYAVNDGLLDSNPLRKVGQPTQPQRHVEPVTTDELVALLRHTDGTWLGTLLLVMALSGARPGEALAAAWSDINLDSGRWHISRALTYLDEPGRAGSRRTLGTANPKTPASKATITLPQAVIAALRTHRERQLAIRERAPRWNDPDLVFATTVGTLIDPRNARRELKTALIACGISRQVRLHDMRHAAVTGLLAEGVALELVSKLVRHSRLSTTLDVYGHLIEETRVAAADAMDRRVERLLGPSVAAGSDTAALTMHRATADSRSPS